MFEYVENFVIEKKEIEQTCYIRANYPQFIHFNMDEIYQKHGINKEDVVKLEVRNYGALCIVTKDGQEYVLYNQGVQSEDWKRSISDEYLDKNQNEIVEINH